MFPLSSHLLVRLVGQVKNPVLVPVGSKYRLDMLDLFLLVGCVRNMSVNSVEEGTNYGSFVVQGVIGFPVEVLVGVGGFPVHSGFEGAIIE